ncbi:MAG TPA: EthD domain-containing protein [Candidatus Binataceae bacterium]|nr:EthD domain-containing protein [Candidatus Binataceae bacterium]
MVKIVYCISKLPHLSDDKFHRYWREVHGPIASRIPGCRKYVQSHAIHRALDNRQPSYDGVAELWFDDWQALEAAMGTKEVAAAIEDEDKFIDHSRTAFFIAEEHHVI